MVLIERIKHLLRDGMKLNAAIHPFGIFAENRNIYIVTIVERVARIGFARPQVGVQIEELAQLHDRAEI